MKNNIYIVLFGLLLSMGGASCGNETDLFFDETAAERKANANKEYGDMFRSSEEGWLFQYFPEKTQKYGGYNYVVKFTKDNQVIVWFEGMKDFAEPETSMYDIISYGGPVLTFNTYNSLMHHFAKPSSNEYLGKGGDFEFLIQSMESDTINVKGIKTGNYLRLIKMTETAEEYLTKTKAISDFTASASLGTIINGNVVDIFLNAHQFTFSYIEDDEAKLDKVPFIYTDKGICFYEPVTILGVTAQDFILNKESKKFTSTDGNMVIDIIFPPVDLTLAKWIIATGVEADRSDAVKAAWDIAYTANVAVWNEVLEQNVSLGLCHPVYGDKGISQKSSGYRAHYNLSFGGVLGHSDYLSITKIDGGFNWKWYEHLMSFVDFVVNNAPYQVEMDDAENPTEIKMTSAADPTVWFILRQ